MLSPDPVTQAPENGQNYNRYTYANNNPLKYTDPSGFEASDGELVLGYDIPSSIVLTVANGLFGPGINDIWGSIGNLIGFGGGCDAACQLLNAALNWCPGNNLCGQITQEVQGRGQQWAIAKHLFTNGVLSTSAGDQSVAGSGDVVGRAVVVGNITFTIQSDGLLGWESTLLKYFQRGDYNDLLSQVDEGFGVTVMTGNVVGGVMEYRDGALTVDLSKFILAKGDLQGSLIGHELSHIKDDALEHVDWNSEKSVWSSERRAYSWQARHAVDFKLGRGQLQEVQSKRDFYLACSTGAIPAHKCRK